MEKLACSKVYQEYERAFSQSTGLPLALTPVESWGLPHHGHENENPLCSVFASAGRTCGACLEVHQSLGELAVEAVASTKCYAGLLDSAVPLKASGETVGYLRTGQIRTEPPSEEQFEKLWSLLQEWNVPLDRDRVRLAYFHGQVLGPSRYEAMVRLLEVFAEHLGLVCHQILLEERNKEAPVIARAREFIAKNQSEDISLEDVARAVNTSTFYFCKMFKKATGLTFTDYLGRVRIEKAKELMINPHKRISEVAFEVGFQSLSQFNRVFKKVTGSSPSDFRVHARDRF